MLSDLTKVIQGKKLQKQETDARQPDFMLL